MATLLLTVAGTALSGPIGGAIGAMLGQQIDQRLLAPKRRSGPRLNELTIQTSSYGAPLPRVFGTARLSGTVIWATDLKETRRTVKAGKGQPKQTVYSYSASFAVALSARRIIRIGRIWADGNLLRGAAGDFKAAVTFRLHTGDGRQPPDPLLASAEASGKCPAYRGLAYAVFEDLELGDFGNRIPSLSFEVIADDEIITVASMLATHLPTGAEAACAVPLGGIAVTGGSARGLIEALEPALGLFAHDDGAIVRIADTPGLPVAPQQAELGAAAGDTGAVRHTLDRQPAALAPHAISIAYHDSSRDYQPGVQQARRAAASRREERIDLAATLLPATARSLADATLARRHAALDTARITLPITALPMRPGMVLTCPGLPGTWHISAVTVEAMIVRLDLRRHTSAPPGTAMAEPGRLLVQSDAVHGPTILAPLDLPWLEDGLAPTPTLLVAANGTEAGWRRAALATSIDNGETWQDAGLTALPAIMGTCLDRLDERSPFLIDWHSSVTVELDHAADALTSTNLAQMLAGANLALVGDELIQFMHAEPLGANQFRLSGLLRGRRGTEWAIPLHTTNARFILIERETLSAVTLASGQQSARVMATGIGDTAPALSPETPCTSALLPPAPVHLRATRLPGGATQIDWVRRSRLGWAWSDHVDAPLGEESETYALTVTPSVGLERTLQSPVAQWTYSAAEHAADVAAGATTLAVSIRQIGTHGLSRSTMLSFALI